MAPLKRKCGDAAAAEDAPATKHPMTTQDSEPIRLSEVLSSFGTLSSQRPKRERRRPERYSDLSFQSPSMKQTAIPKTTSKRSSKNPEATAKRNSLQSKMPRNSSRVVSLKVPLDSPSHAMSDGHNQEHGDDESDLSSPPASLLSSPVSNTQTSQTNN